MFDAVVVALLFRCYEANLHGGTLKRTLKRREERMEGGDVKEEGEEESGA